MARARNIKPAFFQNPELVELRYEVRLLFIGLWTMADKSGRLEDRPKKIKMELFPADDIDIDSALSDLGASRFVRRYEVVRAKVFIDQENPINKDDFSKICSFGYETLKYKEDSSVFVFLKNEDLEAFLDIISDLGASRFAPRCEVEKIKVIQIVNFAKHQKPHHQEKDSELPSEPISEPVRTKVGVNPSDSLNLIPDRGLLIPDRGLLIEDAGLPEESADADLPIPHKKFSESHLSLAEELAEPVRAKRPKQKINIEQWADDVRKLNEIDGYTLEQIAWLWTWIQNHEDGDFRWGENILSPSKLRKSKDGLTYFEKCKGQAMKPRAETDQERRARIIAERNAALGFETPKQNSTYEAEYTKHEPDRFTAPKRNP